MTCAWPPSEVRLNHTHALVSPSGRISRLQRPTASGSREVFPARATTDHSTVRFQSSFHRARRLLCHPRMSSAKAPFHHSVVPQSSLGGSRWLPLAAALMTLVGAQIWFVFTDTGSALSNEVPRPVWLVAQALFVASVATMAWRVVLVARYRTTPSAEDDALPVVTVIVPAYNEGRQVFDTIASLARCDYPNAKLHILAVDDGSVDDTWLWMSRAANTFASVATAIRCPVNRGKRHALYEGFQKARGAVVVTVDSDSEVLPDTLRNLVSPFVADPRVGAVAGNVRVLNRTAGVIPRMMEVSFSYAFEFMRASESEVGAVQCCPGALSAFRLDFVREVQDEWVEQTFVGRPANIGEDRAMTNLALERGLRVQFQADAIVVTEVPTDVPQLARMFLRWARSNVRETLVLAGFVFGRFRDGSKLGPRINFIWSALQIVLAPLGLAMTLAAVVLHPELLGLVAGGVLLSAVWPATIFAIARGAAGAVWAFPYALLSATALSWIGPYALVSVHRSGWLTRRLVDAGGQGPCTDSR